MKALSKWSVFNRLFKRIFVAFLSLACLENLQVFALKHEGTAGREVLATEEAALAKESYEKYVWKDAQGRRSHESADAYNDFLASQARAVYEKLCEISRRMKEEGIKEFAEDYTPEKYEKFCEKYVCPSFYEKPVVLPKSKYERLDDFHIDLYRGINADDVAELKKFFYDFKYGPFFTGHEKMGSYCTGNIYTPRNFAKKFDIKPEAGYITRFCYNEQDIKVICEEDLKAITDEYLKIYEEELQQAKGIDELIFNLLEGYFIVVDDGRRNVLALAGLAQYGLSARILGYDIILIDEFSPDFFGREQEHPILKTSILNRSKIIVQDEPVEVYVDGQLVEEDDIVGATPKAQDEAQPSWFASNWMWILAAVGAVGGGTSVVYWLRKSQEKRNKKLGDE